MQSSHSKLILLISPIILLAAMVTHPVFDDWTYYTSPCDFNEDGFLNLLPKGNHWRPFDAALGYMLWLQPELFPWVNHIIVVIGHVINALLLCKIGKLFKLDSLHLYIAVLVFYLSTGMIATVLNTDSFNQVYSHLWGFLGLWIYLTHNGTKKYVLWCSTIMIATLCKENGMMWAWATPLTAWGLQYVDKKETKKDILIGTAVMVVYLLIRFSLSQYIVDTESDDYFNTPLLRHIRGIAMLLGYSFVPLDYVSIVHPPTRNILLAAITAVLCIPFLLLLLKNLRKADRRLIVSMILAIIILALPHLLTIYSSLHPYASLSISSILIAVIIQKEKNKKTTLVTFSLYLVAIIISGTNHWIKSYESGMTGKKLAEQAIAKTRTPVEKVYLIEIDTHETKYSSFCTIPYEAFGWGLAACNETHYKWPKYINEELIDESKRAIIPSMIENAKKEGYRTFWIVEKDQIKVLNF